MRPPKPDERARWERTLCMRDDEGMPLWAIAKRLGVSHQRASQLVARARREFGRELAWPRRARTASK